MKLNLMLILTSLFLFSCQNKNNQENKNINLFENDCRSCYNGYYDNLDTALKNSSKVEYLSIHRKKYKTLPNNIINMHNLKGLTISNQTNLDFGDLFEKLSKLDSLKEIEIKYCNIRRNSNNFYGLENLNKLNSLKELTIIDSILDYFPYSIVGCQKLEVLNLISPIKHIPKEINSLKNLKELRMEWNDSEFPQEVLGLINLEILDLNYSKINSLPNELSELNNLNELWIAETPFSKELNFYHRLKQQREYETFNKRNPKCKIYFNIQPPD